MYSYIMAPLDFRLSAWPYGGNQYVKTYTSARFANIAPLLEFLQDQLDRTPQAKVFKTTFSLVNVFSTYFNISIGLTTEPGVNLQRGPVVFTFARTHDTNVGRPETVLWTTSKTALWGKVTTKPDFISISVPINVCVRAGLIGMMTYALQGVYDIVGGFTKNLVMGRKPLALENSMMRDKVFGYTIPKAMWQLHRDDWKYCNDFWQRMPEMLNLQWNAEFVSYYCRYIVPKLPSLRRGDVYASAREAAADVVRGFILSHIQGRVLPEEKILYTLLPYSDNIVDVEGMVADIVDGRYTT